MTTSTAGRRLAVWSASSYSGSGQLTAPGSAKTTRFPLALSELVEQRAKRRAVGGPAEGESAGNRLDRTRADGDEQRVVVQLGACRRKGGATTRVDPAEPAEREERPALVGDAAQIEAVYAAEPKRLRDRKRAVPELGFGREQLDQDPFLRMVPEAEKRLEAGNAAARDQHVQRAATVGRACVHEETRTVRRRTLSSPIVFIAMPG